MPNLAGVIPAMHRIIEQLKSDVANTQYFHSIRTAVKMGKILLDKYYNLIIDQSEVHQIATGMLLLNITHTIP